MILSNQEVIETRFIRVGMTAKNFTIKERKKDQDLEAEAKNTINQAEGDNFKHNNVSIICI